jgi:hypothetical protein
MQFEEILGEVLFNLLDLGDSEVESEWNVEVLVVEGKRGY